MADAKGKNRVQGLKMLGNLHSTISASAIGLTRSFLSGQSSRELSKNKISGLNGLRKSETSSSLPIRNLAQMEEDGEYPNLKLIHNKEMHGISTDHPKNHVKEPDNELSNFLDCLNFIRLPQSSFCQKQGSYIESISRQRYTQNVILPNSSSGEAERYDGEDVCILLSSGDVIENEIDLFSKTESKLASAPDNGTSTVDSGNRMTSQLSTSKCTDLSNRSMFNFFPNFEDSVAQLDQWHELQESYVEKVWRDDLIISRSAQAIIESPNINKFTTPQVIAVQRLKIIINHLSYRLTKVVSLDDT